MVPNLVVFVKKMKENEREWRWNIVIDENILFVLCLKDGLKTFNDLDINFVEFYFCFNQVLLYVILFVYSVRLFLSLGKFLKLNIDKNAQHKVVGRLFCWKFTFNF